MLHDLLPPLESYFGALNVVRYITFRTAAASLTALLISLLLGPWMIRKLRDFQIGQVIRQEGPQSHRAKAGTPTMGGLLILTAAVVPTLLWADLSNPYGWPCWQRVRLAPLALPTITSRSSAARTTVSGPATRWPFRFSLPRR